jgi:hypothetical protein
VTAPVTTPDHARLRRDVEQLVTFDRRTVGSGERDSARYLAQRLTEIDALKHPGYRPTWRIWHSAQAWLCWPTPVPGSGA